MKRATLREHIRDWRAVDSSVDAGERIVRNVALVGEKSRNGYRYMERALREAVPMYENKPVFLDHAVNQSKPYQRSARDLVGSVVNVRYEGGRVRGDIRVVDTESGRTFLALAEGEAPAVGMSHVVLGVKGDDGETVERIEDVVSVDAVAFPATTRTLRESAEGAAQEEEAESARDELGEENLAEGETEKLVRGLRAERDELRREVECLQEQRKRNEVARRVLEMLESSGLPREGVSEVFRQHLLKLGDEGECRGLIADRRELFERLQRRGVRSEERGGIRRSSDEAAFIAAIRTKG